MLLTPFLKLIKNHQLLAIIKVDALLRPFYKLTFLAAAKNCGLLDALATQKQTLDDLAKLYCHDARSREALAAWLQFGCRVGLLSLSDSYYALEGLALKLSRPENDATLALVQEVATLHHKYLLETPTKLRKKQLWQLSDQDGELTTRSSRALEVFQIEAINRVFSKEGSERLLEIGCGSAIYMRYAAIRNPSLEAVGLELQPAVADLARANIQQWGLESRVAIEIGDVRERAPKPEFDCVTLYNNIYYFPVDERIILLRHVRSFLKPSGSLLLTTCCQGGSAGMEMLNLWGAATAGSGRLPTVEEMSNQLTEAGFNHVDVMRLIPGDSFYAFHAHNKD